MVNIRDVFSRELLAILALLVLAFAGLFLVLPPDVLPILAAFTAMAVVYFAVAALLARYDTRTPPWLNAAPAWLVILFPVIVGIALLFRYWVDATIVSVAFVLALMFVFMYYWLLVPLALVQKLRQLSWAESVGSELDEWPDITVLVPAYKERGYIGRLLDSISAARYPSDVELIVVDDGSLDGTYEEAKAHATTDATIIRKENGGKHSALNRGLEAATNEIIVSIDADSWIAPDALVKLVREFERNPDAGAIAGNVKVGNRGSFITKLQALEYIVGINTFRRAFDHVGLVTVVPGCLGAFRADILEDVKGYSADTLTEDFDLTIEILKRGYDVHASEGIVYTEAPNRWRRLYRQRLRWYRGNIQTLLKHATVFTDSGYGLLHRLGFPYALLSMTLLPLFGILALAVIPFAVLAGETYLLVVTAVFFLLLIVLLSLLAIEIDGENRRLAALAPFSIIGYKQFLDVILLRSIFDVLSGRRLGWTSPGRINHEESSRLVYDPPTAVKPEPDAGAGMQLNGGLIETYRDAADEWRWRLPREGGGVLADSGEGYASRSGIETAADRVRALAAEGDTLAYDPAGIEFYRDSERAWRWRLRHRDGRAIAESARGYAERSDAREALERARARATDDGRWEVTVGEMGGHHWRLVAPSGTVLATNAELLPTESDAEAALEGAKTMLPEADSLDYDPASFEVYVDTGGRWRWRLRHRNGNIVADGARGYESRDEATAALERFRERVGTEVASQD